MYWICTFIVKCIFFWCAGELRYGIFKFKVWSSCAGKIDVEFLLHGRMSLYILYILCTKWLSFGDEMSLKNKVGRGIRILFFCRKRWPVQSPELVCWTFPGSIIHSSPHLQALTSVHFANSTAYSKFSLMTVFWNVWNFKHSHVLRLQVDFSFLIVLCFLFV